MNMGVASRDNDGASERSSAEIGDYDGEGRRIARGCRLATRQHWIIFGHQGWRFAE
jgi:hypothetical protein